MREFKRKQEEQREEQKKKRKAEGAGPGRPRKAVGPLDLQRHSEREEPERASSSRTAVKQRNSRQKRQVKRRRGQMKTNWWKPHLIKHILRAVREEPGVRPGIKRLQRDFRGTFDGLPEVTVRSWFVKGACDFHVHKVPCMVPHRWRKHYLCHSRTDACACMCLHANRCDCNLQTCGMCVHCKMCMHYSHCHRDKLRADAQCAQLPGKCVQLQAPQQWKEACAAWLPASGGES